MHWRESLLQVLERQVLEIVAVLRSQCALVRLWPLQCPLVHVDPLVCIMHRPCRWHMCRELPSVQMNLVHHETQFQLFNLPKSGSHGVHRFQHMHAVKSPLQPYEVVFAYRIQRHPRLSHTSTLC